MDYSFNNIFEGCISSTVLSTASNSILSFDNIETYTYRTYIKPSEYGNLYMRFWHNNIVDSSWDDGSYSRANLTGGNWKIESAFLGDGGLVPNGGAISGSQVQLLFNGDKTRTVTPGENFFSDFAQIKLPEDHYLVFTWTITNLSTGKVLPYNCDQLLATVYKAKGDASSQVESYSFEQADNLLVLPSAFMHKSMPKKKICFIGDSITQGIRTNKDMYENWVSKISSKLSTEYSVWNIGSGWARAVDAASNGAWLSKAKLNDEIVICLGVNDIGTLNCSSEQLIQNIDDITNNLKKDNPKCNIILCTVPPFDFCDSQEIVWRTVNNAIRSGYFKNADRVFDIAAVLSQPAPNDNLEKPEYHSPINDAHPNGIAGTAIAETFLLWY